MAENKSVPAMSPRHLAFQLLTDLGRDRVPSLPGVALETYFSKTLNANPKATVEIHVGIRFFYLTPSDHR